MLVFEWNAMPNNFIGFWLEFIVGWKSFFQTFFFLLRLHISLTQLRDKWIEIARLSPPLSRRSDDAKEKNRANERYGEKKKSLQRSKNRVNFYWIEENLVWGEKRKHHKKNWTIFLEQTSEKLIGTMMMMRPRSTWSGLQHWINFQFSFSSRLISGWCKCKLSSRFALPPHLACLSFLFRRKYLMRIKWLSLTLSDARRLRLTNDKRNRLLIHETYNPLHFATTSHFRRANCDMIDGALSLAEAQDDARSLSNIDKLTLDKSRFSHHNSRELFFCVKLFLFRSNIQYGLTSFVEVAQLIKLFNSPSFCHREFLIPTAKYL